MEVCAFWVPSAVICAKNIDQSNENHTCSVKGYSILACTLLEVLAQSSGIFNKSYTDINREHNKQKEHPQYLLNSYTRLNIVFLCSGIVALIEAPTQLQVVEPHLEKCVDVTCCTQIGQANKCVLEGGRDRNRERQRERESINCNYYGKSVI